jgi:hypothetical protein
LLVAEVMRLEMHHLSHQQPATSNIPRFLPHPVAEIAESGCWLLVAGC